MPVVHKHLDNNNYNQQRAVTGTNPLKLAPMKPIKVDSPFSALGAATEQAANFLDKIETDNQSALSDAANAQIMNLHKNMIQRMQEAKGANALSDTFISKYQDEFNQEKNKILDTLPGYARNRSDIWLSGHDLEGSLNNAGLAHQSREREELQTNTFKLNMSMYRSDLESAIVSGDHDKQFQAASHIADTLLSRSKQLGETDEMAVARAQLTVNNVVEELIARKSGSMSVADVETMRKSLGSFLNDGVKKTLDDLIRDKQVAFNTLQGGSSIFNSYNQQTNPQLGITFTPSSGASGNSMSVTSTYGFTANVQLPNRPLSFDDLPSITKQLKAGFSAVSVIGSKQIPYIRDTIYPLCQKIGAAKGVDPEELCAMILIESGGNPNAVSSKGAKGIAQFMPETAKRFGVDVNNVESSINGMADYLNFLRKDSRFQNNGLYIGAYNCGEGNMASVVAGKMAMPGETRKYIPAVLAMKSFIASIISGEQPKNFNAGASNLPNVTEKSWDQLTVGDKRALIAQQNGYGDVLNPDGTFKDDTPPSVIKSIEELSRAADSAAYERSMMVDKRGKEMMRLYDEHLNDGGDPEDFKHPAYLLEGLTPLEQIKILEPVAGSDEAVEAKVRERWEKNNFAEKIKDNPEYARKLLEENERRINDDELPLIPNSTETMNSVVKAAQAYENKQYGTSMGVLPKGVQEIVDQKLNVMGKNKMVSEKNTVDRSVLMQKIGESYIVLKAQKNREPNSEEISNFVDYWTAETSLPGRNWLGLARERVPRFKAYADFSNWPTEPSTGLLMPTSGDAERIEYALAASGVTHMEDKHVAFVFTYMLNKYSARVLPDKVRKKVFEVLKKPDKYGFDTFISKLDGSFEKEMRKYKPAD